jgi:predicted acyltransferase
VVGSNSIAIYVMSQLLGPWVDSSIKTHLAALDAATGWAVVSALTGGAFWPVWRSLLRLTFYWLVCWYLYSSRIFIKI